MKQANPHKRVVIQEDNATPHQKARRLLQPEIYAKGIEFVKHPPNSPDLAPIETLQWEHEKRLDHFRFNVDNAKQSTKQQAIQLIKEVWQSPQFDEVVEGRVSRAAYNSLGLRVKGALGTNLINDDVNVNR